jgi:aerobic-type carbon monoxide dehydrogenase small subunit (CoxS/CutS family)
MVSFVLNGKPVAADADSQTPLLWIIRDHIGLTVHGRTRAGGSECVNSEW